jgi:hypothetical protein
MQDQLLERVVSELAKVHGIVAIVLGGSRARGTANAGSDFDLGLYYGSESPLDTNHLLEVTKSLVDDPAAAAVTAVGEWGPWIVGGGWLSVDGQKVDLLYRNTAAVEQVIRDCCSGSVSMDYQPGHPHGFCSAIWVGEVALCLPVHDPQGIIARLKSLTLPYPTQLRHALIGRFRWEVLFSIQNAEIAVSRRDQTHIAGCAYRALCCVGQVLFAVNDRYLINEKGALAEAAGFPLTIRDLTNRVQTVWQQVGCGELYESIAELRALEAELTELIAGNT